MLATRIVVGEIAGHTADEQVTPSAIEGIFGRDARICAAQDGGVRVLTSGQCLPLMLEVVAPRRAFDIARISFHQFLEGGIRRQHVLRLGRSLGILGASCVCEHQPTKCRGREENDGAPRGRRRMKLIH